MPYPVIPSRRLPYDIDGTEIGRVKATASNFPTTWLSSLDKSTLNRDIITGYIIDDWDYYYYTYFLFFTELKEIEFIYLGRETNTQAIITGSTDSTNGVDGTWETAVLPSGLPVTNGVQEATRTAIVPISFSGPVKILRVQLRFASYSKTSFFGVHFYGRKYATETPDDLLFVDSSTGAELTSLTDWGDRPEGTTIFKQIKVKNASITKTANNINLQLNHADFLMSWNAGGPWQATLDITSLGAGAESATIYLKNELGPPNLALGPKAARMIATVGSWT